ncbi:MAG: polysaccharide deacetylase family protein [Microthrixaceae bacterium]
MPILTLAADAGTRERVTTVVALAVAVGVAVAYGRWARGRVTVWLGPVVVGVAALLYTVTPAGAATAILAAPAGAGVGLACGPGAHRWWPSHRMAALVGGCAGLATLGAGGLVLGRGGALLALAAAMTVVPPAVAALLHVPAEPAGVRPRRALVAVVMAGVVGLLLWTGANDPQLSWFGPVVPNGPRDSREVAITFDDGPNGRWTLETARLMDERGAKGTYFVVGKAVEAQPEVVRRLLADGHLVGNHSFHHDYWRWLNPLYPELPRTQTAIERATGTCPALYRPPHGQRTPFITAQVAAKGMRTITWDVSGGDWATDDGALVARRILAKVRPGSIILLHDGIDGNVGTNRDVVLGALPLILDGLRERGLRPVRLDQLVDVPTTLRTC